MTENPAVGSRQILLDSPTTEPALGYRGVGQAFASIISQSEPRFAIGIFGGWGSGKTTLMDAIRAALVEDSLVSVAFNAWRFEREPQILVPLLDTIRSALVAWSESRDRNTREKIRSIANRIGRVVRALATGLSAEVGLPGAAKVSYDVGTALDALSAPGEPESAQSLYVAAFQELERAFAEFRTGGVRRVVVFVDDLDRCLPSNALDLLESMKLFFDLPGFVFVVGLDEDVVQRAIRAKFAELDRDLPTRDEQELIATSLTSQRLGREYIKKIFQVPYSLPAMMPQQLDDLLEAMYKEAGLRADQLSDLRKRVRPYLECVAIQRRVNPREVKRFINAYTLQTLVRPELDPGTVLALQTLLFRQDWNLLYNAIFTDSVFFVAALGSFRNGDDSAFRDLAPELSTLPLNLAAYLRSALAEPLTRPDSLDAYLSSVQSARGIVPWFLEAYRQITSLRRQLRNALAGDHTNRATGPLIADATAVGQSLDDLLRATSDPDISSALRQLPREIQDYASSIARNSASTEAVNGVVSSMLENLETALEELLRIRSARAADI
jgi:KAP family P-loop domain